MKILVIGAAGMLGHRIFKKLSATFPGKVYGTVRKEPGYYDQFKVFDKDKLIGNVDVLAFKALEDVLLEVKPTWIINCVGITLRKSDVQDVDKCLEINSMLPHKLALWARQNGAKLIHFSTDCVFDGSKGSYTELDIPSAQDLYGKSKFLGEVSDVNALTLRLSIVGRELESKSELVEWFLSQKGKTVKGYTQAIYSGLTTHQVAEEVSRIILNMPGLNGLYQVASEPISKFDLLRLLNEYLTEKAVIEPYENYRVDKTLDCSKYCDATSFVPPKWSEMIRTMMTDKTVDYGD